MQAKDIPDEKILSVVRELDAKNAPPVRGAVLWDIQERIEAPPKVVRAKLAGLIRRGVLEGCPCGCRGDFYEVAR